MKFTNLIQKQMFCIEANRSDLLEVVDQNWEPDNSLIEDFIKNRDHKISSLVNFRKSQSAQSAWRRHRYNYMSGIKAYHKSTKGKQMHRKLGNFIATHDFNDSIFDNTLISQLRDSDESLNRFCESYINIGYLNSDYRINLLKALSSFSTHIFIESEYFRDLLEEVNFRILLSESSRIINESESYIMDSDINIPVSNIEFLIRLLDPDTLVSEYSIAYDTDESLIYNRINSISESLVDSGISKDSDGFYTILFNNLNHISKSKSIVK